MRIATKIRESQPPRANAEVSTSKLIAFQHFRVVAEANQEPDFNDVDAALRANPFSNPAVGAHSRF